MRRYNAYRKRSFNLSRNKRKEYAEQMQEIEEYFDNSDWDISTQLDSCYKEYESYRVRISNHSADNQYHDIYDDSSLLINIKASKLNFIDIIENDIDHILSIINKLDLEKYRFINVVNGNINCFYKKYKTKKDVYSKT